MAGTRTETKRQDMADLVKNYLKLRGENKNDDLLKLLTDDIVLSDSDNNEHKGNFSISLFVG